MKITLGVVMIVFSLAVGSSAFAGGNDNVGNLFFSINVPDSWTYTESSDTPQSRTTGLGPLNMIELAPSEFSDLLIPDEKFQEKFLEKMQDGGATATFAQETVYRLKNAPLETYVKWVINKLGIQNITSQEYTTVGKEKSVRLSAPYFGNTKTVLYLVMHDKQPYAISYLVNVKNYEKYLPEFEQMVKSLRFVDGALSESDGNLTNTKTNFSGANLTDLSTNNTTNNQEELYNECVNVAGNSLCDYLFKRNDLAPSDTSNNSAFEDWQNKYCPSEQLVKCMPPPGLEDPGGVGAKNCSDFDKKNFKVQPGDPYGLDRDGDGIACEG